VSGFPSGGGGIATPVTQWAPGNPAATASTVGVMMGLAGAITPEVTGKVSVILTGSAGTLTAGVTATLRLYQGTGVAPVNGAAVTGTPFGSGGDPIASDVGLLVPFAISGGLTGLALGVPIWVDIWLKTSNAADSAEIGNLEGFIYETY
jgi:hypothetical protein